MKFSKRLLDLREEKNIQQKELGAIIGIKPNNLSKYESGISKPQIMTVIKLAEYFEVSVDYLLGLSDIRNPNKIERLAPKEKVLVGYYRKLTPENQIRVDERIRTMLDNQQ